MTKNKLGKIRNLVFLIVIVLVIALIIGNVKIQSVDDYYLTHIDEIKPNSQTVYFSIECETILNNYDKLDALLKDEKYVPKDGKILASTEYVLRPNDSAFDMLKRVTRAKKIAMEFSGSDKLGSSYISGINQIYEFSCGALSGWMYKINGEFPPYSCNKVTLKDGDIVQFVYSCDLGRDIGGENIDQK